MNTSSLTPPSAQVAAEGIDDLRVTVIVPTYQRPTWLLGCLRSLAQQTRRPDEVIAVMRADDQSTHEAFDTFVASGQGRDIDFRKATVTQPGFLPPLVEGIAAARGDVIAFIDDDAEALPDWLARLLAPYSDPSVAGVGGRVVNIERGAEVKFPPAKSVGEFRCCRPFLGNMYRDVGGEHLRDVDFFMGGNMSYRREALRRVNFDSALAHDVAFHYEVDLGRQVKHESGRLIYDAQARIRHYSAPRVQHGMRKPDRSTIFWYNHNALYIVMKHAPAHLRWFAVAYSYAIGSSRSWGVLSALASIPRQRSLQALRELVPAFAGKARGIRSYLTWRRAVRGRAA